MNYCSLKDAWSNNTYISKQFNDYMNPYLVEKEMPSTIEHFADVNPTKIKSKECSDINCDDIINHLKKCKKCSKKVKSLLKSKVLFNLEDLINDNKDTIILVLIGIMIILFLNLVNNILRLFLLVK